MLFSKTLPMSRRRRVYATLPDDLIHAEIIPRLAVKSIGRFRCVSKSWRSLLSTPKFVNSHLRLHANDPKHILLLTKHGCRVYSADFRLFKVISGSTGAGVHGQSNFERTITNLGPSCHGLVLLIKTETKIIPSRFNEDEICRLILMNPITKESLDLPDSPRALRHGLGYDSVSDDFKIVSILRDKCNNVVVDVYRVKMKTRRTHLVANLGYELNYSSHGVFLNGYIYWTALYKTNYYVLAAFNLASEEFEQVPLPSGTSGTLEFRITVVEGCLALVFRSRYAYDVWVMKERGVQDSWIRLAGIHCHCSSGTVRVECLLNVDEILLCGDYGKLFTYNWRNEYCRYVDVDLITGKSTNVTRTFTGSLVSPIALASGA